MHNVLNDIILGIVEGLTEFLPVSSTAHLLIVQDLLGFTPPGDVFPIVIQFGAILAVVAVYWRRFLGCASDARHVADSRRFALGIVVAFLPAAVFGSVLHRIHKKRAVSDTAPKVIATTLIVGGILILIFERLAPPPRDMDGDKLPMAKAFWIGMFQVLAIIPGVSRSGATILGGELIGVDRKAGAALHVLPGRSHDVRRDRLRSMEGPRRFSTWMRG